MLGRDAIGLAAAIGTANPRVDLRREPPAEALYGAETDGGPAVSAPGGSDNGPSAPDPTIPALGERAGGDKLSRYRE